MDKQAQLQKYKWIATLLFVLMAIIYLVCEISFAKYEWAGYVKAFAEAGMVGALADWFAVTALFRHPLGIPIPHTNIIATNKEKIGNNLGSFVTGNFLTNEILQPHIKNLQVASRLGHWLQEEGNREIVKKEMLRIFKDAIDKLNDDEMKSVIRTQAVRLVGTIPVNKIFANGLEKIISDDLHQDWITIIALHLRDLLNDNRDAVRRKVKDESYILIPEFVDNLIADKITNAGIDYLQKLAAQKNHRTRLQITQKLKSIADDIRNDGNWAAQLNLLKSKLLSPDHLNEYSGRLWLYIKEQLNKDLTKNDSAVGNYLDKMLNDISLSLAKDAERQQRIDHFVQEQVLRLIMEYKESAGELISNTVANWPAKELSQKLELEVGKDLQYIRINGTIVGGLVGLTIYILTKLFH